MLPTTLIEFNFAMVECMLSPVLIWAAAEFVFMLTTIGRRFWIHNLVFSVLVSFAWYARSETVLLSGAALAVSILLAAAAFFRRQPILPALRQCARLFGLAAILCAVVGLFVATMDHLHFGRFSSVEDLRAPAFSRAYNDLQLIDAPENPHFVPFSSAQMRLAASVSPAFAEIYPPLQGTLGERFRRISKNEAGVDNEIAGGWLMWAIREAAVDAGYRDYRSQDAFYNRLADEIEVAAREGNIHLLYFPVAFVDPHWRVWAPYLLSSIARTADRVVLGGQLRVPLQSAQPPDVVAEFDRSANRRAALVVPDEPSPKLRRAEFAITWFGTAYRPLIFSLAALAVVLFAAGGWRRLKVETGAFLVLIAAPSVGKVLLMALIDASAYPNVGIDRYVLPAAVFVPSFVLVLLAQRFRGEAKTVGNATFHDVQKIGVTKDENLVTAAL
jgi:hypothetical protein